MKNQRTKKFLSLLLAVLILSLISPSVFADKEGPLNHPNKPVKPSFTYTLTSVTGGGNFFKDPKVTTQDKYTFGLNILKKKNNVWSANVTFTDSGKLGDDKDNTIIKVRIKDLTGKISITEPTPATKLTAKPASQTITLTGIPAKIKSGTDETWKDATVTLKIIATDKATNKDSFELSVSGGKTYKSTTLAGGNITAHYRRAKVQLPKS